MNQNLTIKDIFIPRLVQPAKNDPLYTTNTKNPFIKAGYHLPNCTTYVYSRLMELGVSQAILKQLPTSNAENWYHDTKLPKGKEPKIGSIIVWKGGKYHKAKDGMGHVALVESIEYNKDGSIKRILTSNSGGSKWWYMKEYKPPYKYANNKYKFDGFIYPKEFVLGIEIGEYRAIYSKYVRTSPKVSNNKVKVKDIDPILLKSLVSIKPNDYARLKMDSTFYLTSFTQDSKGNVWGKMYGYYVCVSDKNGVQIIYNV